MLADRKGKAENLDWVGLFTGLFTPCFYLVASLRWGNLNEVIDLPRDLFYFAITVERVMQWSVPVAVLFAIAANAINLEKTKSDLFWGISLVLLLLNIVALPFAALWLLTRLYLPYPAD